VVRDRIELSTFRFSGIRMTIQGQAMMVYLACSDPDSRRVMDVRIGTCMRLTMRLGLARLGRRAGPDVQAHPISPETGGGRSTYRAWSSWSVPQRPLSTANSSNARRRRRAEI
jgi:hypothetical protein